MYLYIATRRWLSWVAVLSVVVCSFENALSQENAANNAPAKPGLNDSFLDPELDVDNWVERFEVESREIYKARNEIVRAVGLKPGERVADIGTGTGLFLPLFAKEVGDEGWLYAVDISPRFIEYIAGKSELSETLDRVTPVICTSNSVRLPPQSIDAAFICDVYHHFEFPAQTLATLHAALKPTGRVIIIDFERIPGVSREWVLDHVRAGKQTVIDEMAAANFELVAERDIADLEENYFLEFRAVPKTAGGAIDP